MPGATGRAIDRPVSAPDIYGAVGGAFMRGARGLGRFVAQNSPLAPMFPREPEPPLPGPLPGRTDLAPVVQTPGARDAVVRAEAATARDASQDQVVQPDTSPGAGATRAIERGAFTGGSPAWATNGTAGQMAQDIRAHGLIDARNAQAMAGITAAEEARGNPTQRAIDAMKLDNAYEAELPYGSTSHVKGTFGSYGWGSAAGMGLPVDGPADGEQPVYRYTMGEARQERQGRQRAIDTAQLKRDPRWDAEAGAIGRQTELADELRQLETDLNEDIAAGRRSPEDAQALYAQAQKKAAIMSGIAGGKDTSGFYRNELGPEVGKVQE